MATFQGKVGFHKALDLLHLGEVVALPTETVYGLAGRIDNDDTLNKIFHLKKRPLSNPLIVHCRDKNQIWDYVSGPRFYAEQLFDAFSPGPLTVLLPRNKKISSLITAGKPMAGFRIPRHPLMQKILQRLDVPLAAPSANIYGKVSPSSASHVLSSFQGSVPVLDGGACKKGLESTIVFPNEQKKTLFILRPGMITKQELEQFVAGWGFSVKFWHKASQPGGQKSHYRPSVPLYIVKTLKTNQEVKDFLAKKFPSKILQELCLSPQAEICAQNLYRDLRELSLSPTSVSTTQKETQSKDKKKLLLSPTTFDSIKQDSVEPLFFATEEPNKHTVLFVRFDSQHKGGLWDTIKNRLIKASSGQFEL